MNFRTTTAAVRTAATAATRNRVRAVLVTGALAAIPVAGLVTATGASAASPSTWDAVASCESTNDWSANTGNGFYGGLQFTPSTWDAYGGSQYAASADQASESQQIAVAENVLASQGPGAWPVCGPEAGLTAGGTSAAGTSSSDSSASSDNSTSSDNSDNGTSAASSGSSSDNADSGSSASSAPSSTSSSSDTGSSSDSSSDSSNGGGSYTVQSGDTLGAIAAANGTSWEALYSANQSTIGADANLIYPGQVLTLG